MRYLRSSLERILTWHRTKSERSRLRVRQFFLRSGDGRASAGLSRVSYARLHEVFRAFLTKPDAGLHQFSALVMRTAEPIARSEPANISKAPPAVNPKVNKEILNVNSALNGQAPFKSLILFFPSCLLQSFAVLQRWPERTRRTQWEAMEQSYQVRMVLRSQYATPHPVFTDVSIINDTGNTVVHVGISGGSFPTA